MGATIRVTTQTRDRFVRLAEATGRPMTQLLDKAADALERKLFFELFDDRYAALRGEPDTWSEIESERETEGGALREGSA